LNLLEIFIQELSSGKITRDFMGIKPNVYKDIPQYLNELDEKVKKLMKNFLILPKLGFSGFTLKTAK